MSQSNVVPLHDMRHLKLDLQRDDFARSIIRELSGLLEDMVGLEEAQGYISLVGQHIGDGINQQYRSALQVDKLDQQQIAEVLQDLKARIHGRFVMESLDENKVVFSNSQCPFEDKVIDRPSLCMMTSNVFGTICAENNGYAKVSLEKTIAQGDGTCRVVVYFNDRQESRQVKGREYFAK